MPHGVSERKEIITTTTRCSRNFKTTKKTNLKNLQNKKISVCPSTTITSGNTKAAFSTLDNIIIKYDSNNKNTGKLSF